MSKRIASFCSDLIATSGPQTLPDLAGRVRAAGLTKARNPESVTKSALSQFDGIVRLPDDRYDTARRMLDGAVLTHRVRAATSGRRVLYAGPELSLFDDLFAAGSVPLAGGGEVRRSTGDLTGLVGPAGWLPEVPADSLLAVRVAAGVLSVEPVTDSPQTLASRAERLRLLMTRHLQPDDEKRPGRWSDSYGYEYDGGWSSYGGPGTGWRRYLTRTVLRALAECPELLAEPTPPLDEVLPLPSTSWWDAWTERAWASRLLPPQAGSELTLHGVPDGLRAALARMAEQASVPVEELAVLQLAAATYRWQEPCRHDAEQAWLDRFAREERTRAQRNYDDLLAAEPPSAAFDDSAFDPSFDPVFGGPPDDHDLRPYDEMRELHDDEFAGPADVVSLTAGSRRAAPAASSGPHSGRRPR